MKLMDRIMRRTRPAGVGQSSRPVARMLRDTKSGVLAARQASLVDSRDEIRRSWRRAAALAMDFIQNSGRLKGACDQVLADTVGVELVLNPQPDLSKLGYSEKETAAFVSLVKKRWKFWAWNPVECDLRGKFTVPQMIDISLRWYIAYGEVTGLLSYMARAERARYGISTGTKVCMTPPTRLAQDTREIEGLFQGIYHDEIGRPVAYLFEDRETGFSVKRPYSVRDNDGRHIVMHVFDPVDATDVRGISLMTPMFRKHAQHEILDEATLQTSIMQTIFAAILTSPEPSKDAFEAISALEDDVLREEFEGYLLSTMDRAKSGGVNIDATPQVSHMGPGEDLQFRSPTAPGGNYLPLSASLSRDTARAIGVTYGSLTMNHEGSTYSSVRMENASIWPVVLRRRERIAAPTCQMIYENWLDEEIGEGRIPFKGGYEAFRANRQAATWAQWQGPAKPTADDWKSERAATERMQNGTSSIEIECADKGIDADELFEQRQRTHKRYVEAGMISPYAPRGQQSAMPVEDTSKTDQEAA